jgi:serine/threonine-protein kinase
MNLEHGFPPAAGSIVNDKFVVTRFIGSGGTGVVLAARDRNLGRLVAIKFLQPELAASREIVSRFLREARATSRLKSEHVVRILDVGTLPNDMPYFVMEHLTGTDLSSRLSERGPFSIDEVLDYVLQALEAIAEAHRNGIVHRDLKPENLLLTTREDDSDFIKVLDFGTSKLRSQEVSTLNEVVTRKGTLLGSPLYMSPEQIRDASEADARSDIWSIGVVMHELLTGQPPFQGQFLAEIIGSVCGDDYALPAREDLPAELAEILMKCLQKEADDRFQSVEELARAFLPLIRTVASQVSIERILRIPSSPPPRVELPEPEDLTLRRISLSDTLKNPASVLPHAGAPRNSRAPRAPRNWLTPLTFLLLGAAGTFTWFNLRSEPAGGSSTERTAPAAQGPVSPPTAAEIKPSDALSPTNRAEPEAHGQPQRPHAPQARPLALTSSAHAPSVPPSAPSTSPKIPRPRAGDLRSLDNENPFAGSAPQQASPPEAAP